MVEAEKTLLQLSDKASKLNKSSDEINRLISAFESKLADMKIGVEVWVEDPGEVEFNPKRVGYLSCYLLEEPKMGAPKSNEHWRVWTLGYSKIKEKWQIAIKVSELAKVGGDYIEWGIEEYPLAECSREFRIQAIGMMGALFGRLNEKIEKMLDDINKGKEFLKSID